MFKIKKIAILLAIFSSVFILISSASASDYYVNGNTTHKNIANWMKNSAENGNSLIFNTPSYELTNTLNITKDITIKSDKNTKINFNKNKDMFSVNANGVTFTGLTLNFNGQGKSNVQYGAISVMDASKRTTKNLNIINTTINVNKKYSSGVLLGTLQGNFVNSKINTKKESSHGIMLLKKWTGNLINSSVSTKGKDSIPVYAPIWGGAIQGARITASGSDSPGIVLINSKGTVSDSDIKSSKSYAAMVSDNVNLSKAKLSSKKGLSTDYRYRPDLTIYNHINVNKNTYTIKVQNVGFLSSGECYLGVRVKDTLKKYKVKALKSGKSVDIKVKIPSKYANNKYTKTIKVDYYNKIKETNKKNNIGKFKF